MKWIILTIALLMSTICYSQQDYRAELIKINDENGKNWSKQTSVDFVVYPDYITINGDTIKYEVLKIEKHENGKSQYHFITEKEMVFFVIHYDNGYIELIEYLDVTKNILCTYIQNVKRV